MTLLDRWLTAGINLGNHTYLHGSLNSMTADAYIADIARNEAETGRLVVR